MADIRPAEELADREDGGRPARRGSAETFAGGVLVAWSALGAVAIHIHPALNGIDHLGFEWIAFRRGSPFLLRVADLGSVGILAAGSLLAGLVCIRRDRRRAVACVGGPLLCAVLVEFVFKPLVARRFEGVLSYPSGNTAIVASLATAWVLAVPSWLRPVVVIVGGVLVGAMTTAMIGLRWHLPSDALAGVVLGVGVVLLVDGVLHLADPAAAPRAAGRSAAQVNSR